MPVTAGRPILFQEIIDDVTTNYPEYVDLVSPSQQNCALIIRPFDLVPPPPDPPTPTFDYSSAILISMVSPPNTTARPATYGGLPIDSFYVSSYQGISPRFVATWPIIAPDVFLELESGFYVDSGNAVNDINAQVDSYILANPDVLVLGTLTSVYTNGVDNSIATCRVAAKQL